MATYKNNEERLKAENAQLLSANIKLQREAMDWADKYLQLKTQMGKAGKKK